MPDAKELLLNTTPGPWQIEPEFPREVHAGALIATAEDILLPEEVAMANAKLIAMAPTLAAENARLRAALEHTPNPHGCRYYNYSILCMAITALRDSGNMTLARELEDVCANQREVLASVTT